MLGLLTACLVACAPAATLTHTVTVAGDSVILVVAIADDLGPQPAGVDSLAVAASLGEGAFELAQRVAKVAGGPTLVRFAWHLDLWAPGQTRGSDIRVQAGNADALCPGGVCWIAPETVGPAWSYTRLALVPNAPPASAVTVESVGLN